MTSPAPESAISFEEYVDRMRPWVDRIIGRRAYPRDVCLNAEDLRQDAQLVLWTVHQKLADAKPTTELCRIGTTAVVRRLITLYHQRRRKYQGTVSLEGVRGHARPSAPRLEDPPPVLQNFDARSAAGRRT